MRGARQEVDGSARGHTARAIAAAAAAGAEVRTRGAGAVDPDAQSNPWKSSSNRQGTRRDVDGAGVGFERRVVPVWHAEYIAEHRRRRDVHELGHLFGAGLSSDEMRGARMRMTRGGGSVEQLRYADGTDPEQDSMDGWSSEEGSAMHPGAVGIVSSSGSGGNSPPGSFSDASNGSASSRRQWRR